MKPYDYESFLGKHEATANPLALEDAREMHIITFAPPRLCYHCGQPATTAIILEFEFLPRCQHCAENLLQLHDLPSNKTYNIEEAACILRIHPHVLNKKLHDGEILGEKIKGKWYINHSELDRLLHLRFELQTADYCSLREAAKRLGVHYQTLIEWLENGVITAQRDPLSHGGQYFLSLKKIETILKERHNK